ncbi:phenylacetate--CoA ligase family protein [Acinetobacter haemolyticus]|uniref:phenylacetate--CoA ligase family protein n=1 Tax=Acinetobacter haemolyticus TaxID=29430 RepID=UPI000F665E2A|nr:phenylacetate--CoA ligase family protein [Acinetobacter haemolyticus]RSC81567.1 phenylacetate--CoA ligase family protein [Acinetobacter haemolyticus]
MSLFKYYSFLPIFLQNLVCTLYGYNVSRTRFNGDFNNKLHHLNETEKYNNSQIFEYKKTKLKEIIESAAKHDFYSVFSNKVNQEDPFNALSSFPITEKNDLLAYDMNKLFKPGYHMHSTSGTTGKALSICKDEESIAMQWAIWIRHRNRFSVNLKDVSVNFTGKPIVSENQKSPPFWRYNAAQKQYLVSSKHINERNIESIVEFLNSIHPKFYSGYPSIISDLSRLALSKGLTLRNHPDVVFCGAENLLDYQAESISKWTNAIITDQYGLTEGNCNFSKCEHGFYHEDFEFCHIELVDQEILDDGSIRGKLIGTAFYNRAFPLIRYNTGDIAVFAPPNFKCSCGRDSQVILAVEGRQDDYIITPDGRRVMRCGYLFRDTFEALEVQIVQEKYGEVIFNAVLSGLGNKSDFEKKVSALFKEYISADMSLIFKYPDFIQKSSTGKFKAILNRINK